MRGERSQKFRWTVVSDAAPQLTLLDEIPVRRVGKGAYRGLEFLEVRAKRLINVAPPGPYPFRFTINPYRGCSHACVYCFARPSHEYLGLGMAEDFDSKIVVKINAPELASSETRSTRWDGSPIALGTNTDPYQAAEGKYRITRAVLGALIERGNRFSILTKSTLILRDLDLLEEAAADGLVLGADFSVGTLDEAVWQMTEPGTPHPRQRIAAMARLNEAGVPSGVMMGPVLPGLSDRPDQLEGVVAAAINGNARAIHAIPLHLKPGVKEHYLKWLDQHRPDLKRVHERRYRDRSYVRADVREGLAALINRLTDKLAPPGHPARRTRSAPSARGNTRPAGTSQPRLPWGGDQVVTADPPRAQR